MKKNRRIRMALNNKRNLLGAFLRESKAGSAQSMLSTKHFLSSPFRKEAIRSTGENESNAVYMKVLSEKTAKETKLPYFRKMLSIWKKRKVNNRFTQEVRYKRMLKTGMASSVSSLEEDEYLSRRRQIAKMLLEA